MPPPRTGSVEPLRFHVAHPAPAPGLVLRRRRNCQRDRDAVVRNRPPVEAHLEEHLTGCGQWKPLQRQHCPRSPLQHPEVDLEPSRLGLARNVSCKAGLKIARFVARFGDPARNRHHARKRDGETRYYGYGNLFEHVEDAHSVRGGVDRERFRDEEILKARHARRSPPAVRRTSAEDCVSRPGRRQSPPPVRSAGQVARPGRTSSLSPGPVDGASSIPSP